MREVIAKYEAVVEDLIKQLIEKNNELEKIIQETEDDEMKSILSEARKQIKILLDYLESQMRSISIYYEAFSYRVTQNRSPNKHKA